MTPVTDARTYLLGEPRMYGLSEADSAAVTAWGEGRGDAKDGSSVEERIGVLNVVRNRLRMPGRYADTVYGVCTQRGQFSCWTPGKDANAQAVLRLVYLISTGQALVDYPLYLETLYLAKGVLAGTILDNTRGSTHYFAPDAMIPAGSVPDWAVGLTPTAVIGSQRFYRVP